MAMRELKFGSGELRYCGIIGTGGIGAGKFFMLNGNHTLGREESRSGHFLDINDYCKQHIILHYIKVLLGESFRVCPVGKTGNDDTGQKLFDEMQETGFEMDLVRKEDGVSTLFSFCFCYPDDSGGNLTTDNSASSLVDEEYISLASAIMGKFGKNGMVMAAPEVPLKARARLLSMGRSQGLFCSASFTSGEVPEVMSSDIPENTDLIAINIDEAAAVAGMSAEAENIEEIVQKATDRLKQRNPEVIVTITAGRRGSWCTGSSGTTFLKSAQAEAISTAGAGDAFFAGILTGLALGLRLGAAQQLATLVAGLSVCSPHTINKNIDRDSLRKFSAVQDAGLSDKILNFLEE
jgi:sugar/nucleoside kinase (ribokinase family)